MRIVHGEGLSSWVEAAQMSPEPPGETIAPRPVWDTIAPAILLESDSTTKLRTSGDHFALKGHVLFETPGDARRDFYVYRNDEKVHFQRGPTESEGTVKLPVDIDIPLDEGVNTLSLYARFGRELHVQEQVIVYRTSAPQN